MKTQGSQANSQTAVTCSIFIAIGAEMNRRSLIHNSFLRGLERCFSLFFGVMMFSSYFFLSTTSQSASASPAVTNTAKHLSNFQMRPVLNEKANSKTTQCPSQKVSDSRASTLQACSTDGKILYALGSTAVGSIDVVSAKLISQGTQPAVLFVFNSAAAKIINAVTTHLTVLAAPKNELAIVFAGRVLLAPRVNQAISEGEIQLSFGTVSKATSFFNQLTSGYTPETPCNKEGQTSKSAGIVLRCQKSGPGLMLWLVASN